MQIEELDRRLERLTAALAHLLAGEFDAIPITASVADDLLGRVEQTVQHLVMDIKTVTLANRDKEAVLLLQQQQLEQQARELAARAATIEQQAAAIRQLSTPVLEVWREVLVLPIIGAVDTARSEALMTDLLDSIARMPTKWVIIDLTGVEFVDTHTADHLLKVVRAAALLGVRCMLSGIQPAVAQTLANIGAELGELATERNLAEALRHCLRQLHNL